MSDIGICCLCGNECNPCSQSCGHCARSYNGYVFGLNPLPENMVDFQHEPDCDQHSKEDFEQECKKSDLLKEYYNEVKTYILENYAIEKFQKFTVKEWLSVIVTWYKDNEKIVRRDDIMSILDTLCLRYNKNYDNTLIKLLSDN